MEVLNISLDDILASVLAFLPKLGLAVGIYVAAHLISRWVVGLIQTAMDRRNLDQEIIVLVQLIGRWLIRGIGLLVALDTIGLDVAGLVAGLGIAGFTLGFALQDVAKNFIAGILLLIQQPFEIEDAIEVAGFSGTVQNISLRTTEMRTWDGRNVLIPNGDVYVKPIVNYSREPYRRLELKVSVKKDWELSSLSSSVLNAIRKVEGILEDPAPEAVWTTSGESSTDLTALYWLNGAEVDLRAAQNQAVDLVQSALDEADPEVSRTVTASTIEGT
jgi:small-conductance mechanosensitive channel